MADESLEDYMLRMKLIRIQQDATSELLDLMRAIIARLKKMDEGEQKEKLQFLYQQAEAINDHISQKTRPFLRLEVPKLVLVSNTKKK